MWTWPPTYENVAYCTHCGHKNDVVTKPTGYFDPSTGKEVMSHIAVCPRRRFGMLSMHSREVFVVPDDPPPND